MKKHCLNPTRFYTHAVSVEGAGKVIYVSGQVSWDAAGKVVGKGQVCKNVTAPPKAAGWDNVIKMNGYMVGLNPERVAAYREVRQRYLKEGALPARTLVGVQALVDPDLLLEVEVVAVV
jgi:enamine deaminase RidA (YjgF/YER057c/UK114 family)